MLRKKYSENYILNELHEHTVSDNGGSSANLIKGVSVYANLAKLKEYGFRVQLVLRIIRSLSNQQIRLGMLTYNYFGVSRSKIKKSEVHGCFTTWILNPYYSWELLTSITTLILPFYYTSISFKSATCLKGNMVIIRVGKLKKLWDNNSTVSRKSGKTKKTDALRLEIMLNSELSAAGLSFVYQQLISKPNALSTR